MIDSLVAFLTSVPMWEIAIIFFAKVLEVTISTFRTIMMSKGFRTIATILSFFEILLWVFVASTVLNGIQESPLKGIVYAVGFTAGIYLGSLLESKLAFGKIMLQVIINKEYEDEVVTMLRNHQYAVTHFDARGKTSDKAILMIVINRRGKEKIIKYIKEVAPNAMMISNEITPLQGGFYTKSRTFK